MTAAFQCVECHAVLEDVRASLGIKNCRSCAGRWVEKARHAGSALCLRNPGRLPARDHSQATRLRRIH
jgi:hypothetical protein